MICSFFTKYCSHFYAGQLPPDVTRHHSPAQRPKAHTTGQLAFTNPLGVDWVMSNWQSLCIFQCLRCFFLHDFAKEILTRGRVRVIQLLGGNLFDILNLLEISRDKACLRSLWPHAPSNTTPMFSTSLHWTPRGSPGYWAFQLTNGLNPTAGLSPNHWTFTQFLGFHPPTCLSTLIPSFRIITGFSHQCYQVLSSLIQLPGFHPTTVLSSAYTPVDQ